MTSELLLMRTFSNDESEANLLPPPVKQSVWNGWRFPLLLGLSAAVLALVCNIVLAAVGYRNHDSELFRGDCNIAGSIDTWSHLIINVLAALSLNASNTAMQCISAPSREDIDHFHARKNRAADIGITSLRNWTIMSKEEKSTMGASRVDIVASASLVRSDWLLLVLKLTVEATILLSSHHFNMWTGSVRLFRRLF